MPVLGQAQRHHYLARSAWRSADEESIPPNASAEARASLRPGVLADATFGRCRGVTCVSEA